MNGQSCSYGQDHNSRTRPFLVANYIGNDTSFIDSDETHPQGYVGVAPVPRLTHAGGLDVFSFSISDAKDCSFSWSWMMTFGTNLREGSDVWYCDWVSVFSIRKWWS